MRLPTPLDLHARVTEIISSTATCPVSWAQHPDPLTLSEILAINERLAEYITGVIDAYLGKKKPLSHIGSVCRRSKSKHSPPPRSRNSRS
jgi:hypothetical protein